ncbi:MAG: ATP-dependent DNA helicase DinG [Gammaproteobacteria bacterium]
MLSDSLKEEIQAAYSQLLEQKGYKARYCQKLMIAEIARTLGEIDETPGRICVAEAGTGTGKTIAYAMAAIPIAKQLKKKVVIATATVALQEQIVYQDLPDIRHRSGLDFSFALAKGRRRYLCLSKLDLALQESNSMHQTLSFFDDPSVSGSTESDAALYQAMLNGLGHGTWDGERDSWPEEVDPVAWSRVSTDHAQCTQRQCSHYENCYFYKARESIHRVDCIVTNQDLVLADLMMGGGAVLPEPEETLYIFDECHHLADKAGHHFSHQLSLYSTRAWLMQIPTSLSLAASDVAGIAEDRIGALAPQVESIARQLDEMARSLMPLKEAADDIDDGWRYRFPLGRLDQSLAVMAGDLAKDFSRLGNQVEVFIPVLEDAVDSGDVNERELAEHWLSVISAVVDRLSAATSLWLNLAEPDLSPPYARWLRFSTSGQVEGLEIQLSSHPVSCADELQERLWDRCAGAVMTSATISVGGDFSNFQRRTGIDPEHRFVSLPSPFAFEQQGVLQIPAMTNLPGDADAHTEELASLIPQLVADDLGVLVLFTSWRQMLRVYDDLEADFARRVLMQGDLGKQEILRRHREQVDAQAPSCIFGLASFAEGVDLPGEYCTHVVIAKLPFSVPDDPIDATLSEWIEDQGGNSFYDLMLPNAAIRVVQAAGRLLRTETDSGRVSILDRRLVTKSYGRLILNALPPFRREIH